MAKNKKFNKGTLGTYFPIHKHRFDTTKHPIRTNKEKKTKKKTIRMTHNELQVLEGLTNILQCKNSSEAIRIAMYEQDSAVLWHRSHSALMGANRGIEAGLRNHELQIRLTESECVLLRQGAEQWRITEAEALRYYYLELAESIRRGDIRSLTKSKKISQKQLNREWLDAGGRDRQGGSTLKALHAAKEKSFDEAVERQERENALLDDWLLEHSAEAIDLDTGRIDYDLAKFQMNMACWEGAASLYEDLEEPMTEEEKKEIEEMVINWETKPNAEPLKVTLTTHPKRHNTRLDDILDKYLL